MSVKAFAAMNKGEELQNFNYEAKTLEPLEVEVKITHCGICHSDVHLIDDDWGFSVFPLVPGHEVVGIVSNVGNDVNRIKVGDRVGVGWQSGSCHECEWCDKGEENMCDKAQPTCVGRYGGFADSIITDSRFTFLIPDALESENAAPLLCGGITVYSPMKIFGLQAHHKVGVIGIGGLGHLAIQFASAMGCEVTAFSTSPEKESEAKQFGAHNFVVSTNETQMEKAVNSMDLIISTASASINWTQYVNILRKNGKISIVGASPGNLDVPAVMLLMGQKSIGGSGIGGNPLMREMLEFAARHNIKAKTEVMPMVNVNDAIQKVRDYKARYRMVLEN